jgi:Superinfection immunity protein
MESLGGFILLVILGAIYFIPWLTALGRSHHQAPAIGMVNLLFGWTLLGWCVALCMACTAVRPTTTPTP